MIKWLKPEYCIHRKHDCNKCEEFNGSICLVIHKRHKNILNKKKEEVKNDISKLSI